MTKKNAKETTSKLFNRYVWLVDTIYRRGGITFEEINNCWQKASLNDEHEEFPLRTFHDHRAAIEEMFDIIIECNRQNGYKYYIENEEEMKNGGVRSWLLNTLTVNNLIKESHKLKQRILFEKIPSGQIYLTPIIEAMRDNLSIEMVYHSFLKENSNTIEVHPYCLKIFKQRWYLIAYTPSKKQVLTYALDRIQDLKISDHSFSLPKDFDSDIFFADYFGIIAGDGKKTEDVLIKVYKRQDSYIRTLPLHYSQKEVESTPDYTLFSYRVKLTFDFRQELLSHGSDIEILAPESFREEIAEIITEQNRIYNNKQK